MSTEPTIPQGLRLLADYLDDHDVPMPRAADASRHMDVDAFDRLAEAREQTGLTLSAEDSAYPILTRMFGPVKLEFQCDGALRRQKAARLRLDDLERREAAVTARENEEQAA